MLVGVALFLVIARSHIDSLTIYMQTLKGQLGKNIMMRSIYRVIGKSHNIFELVELV